MFLPISLPLSRWRQDDQPRRANGRGGTTLHVGGRRGESARGDSKPPIFSKPVNAAGLWIGNINNTTEIQFVSAGQCLIAKQKVDAKRAGNSRVYEVNVERTTIARDGTLSLVLR